MSSTRHSPLLFLVAGLLPAMLLAAWNDHQQGSPVLDFFPNRIIGATPQTTSMIQDSQGRLFVGSDALLVYDGVNWTSHTLPASYSLNALCFGPDQKLWAGAHNQIGYYTESSSGTFNFTSLLSKLPLAHRRIDYTWGCGLVGQLVYFVCQSKVLRWDGDKFTIWDFPTESRLYPVHVGQELWFTHLETGLYRLTANGPQFEYGPKALPKNPAFGIEREGGMLRLFSRDGICNINAPQQQLGSPEVIEFLRTRPLSGIQRLPDGNFALGTLGGLGVISADGRLLRTLSQEDGLTSNAIASLFLDQENQLWLGHETGGLARFDPTGAVSLFQHWGQANHASIYRLTQANSALFAATDSGLFQLATKATSRAQFLPTKAMLPYYDAGSHPNGLLLGRFGGIDFFDGEHLQTIQENTGQAYWRILPAQMEPGVFFSLNYQKIAKIFRTPENHWQKQDLVELAELTSDCYVDPKDNLWYNSARSGIWHFDTTSQKTTNIHHGKKPGFRTEISQLTGHGQTVYFFTTREGYTADIKSKAIQRISSYPEVTALQCITSPDGKRLYVVFERKHGTGTSYGLGRLLLAENGDASGWTELQVPKLEAAGVPSTLLVTTEDGPDALWVGGSAGVVRIKPDELTPVRPPAQPYLKIIDTSRQPSPAGSVSAYTYFDHHLLIQVGTPEIDARPHLLFQTRLGHGREEWSPASSLGSFEFTNLTDGNYTFEARALNEAGLISDPVAYNFRILPPWYRTPEAYAGFAAIIAATVFGYIRFRERGIRARNQQLEALVKNRTTELVKANAAKDEFLAGISHEIRNPMNGVIGIATVIDSSQFDPATRQHMAQLRHCATHLSSLLEDILDYSRLQAGAVDLNPQPFDLVEMTEALTALTTAESTRYDIPVEIAISPTVPRYLVGDVARLRQILLNYVVNALKYSGRGKVCLTIWGQQLVPEQIALTFAVSDDGPGISPDEQARLFTRFERGAAAQTQRIAGTGLGLALCKTLGEKMGGRLWVESEPGHGATFYLALSLPVASSAPARLTHQKIKAGPISLLHALVVDDEEYNRITLSSFLYEVGFQVTTAATGEEALAIARQQTLHAIFLDVNLPGQSGPAIARTLRNMPNVGPHLPIIATTAYTTAEKRQQCSEAGMNAFLTKPVSLEKIHAALTAASSAQRPAPSYHPPGQNLTIDPLSSLRLLAERKGIPLETELALYFTELADEERRLTAAMKLRDSTASSDSAHRLIGRLCFIHAMAEADLARDIEANSMNEFWDQADASAARLIGQLPDLRDRMMPTNPIVSA